MKKCLACGGRFPSTATACTACGMQPQMRDGFAAHAPAFADGGGGFQADYFANLMQLEEGNFWFRARNRLVVWALQKYSPGFASMLEIGCGTGYVLSGIAQAYPQARLYGSEIFSAGLRFAAQRQPGIEFMQMDGRQIPYAEEFDVIGAFDVLEHIQEDEAVLAQMWSALKPGGTLVLTVPQHAWLWSAVDEYACHVRRYSAAELQAKVKAAGFNILRSTSFVSTLLPAMYASRLLQKSKPAQEIDASAELRIAPWMNALFEKMLGFELALIRRGIDLPAGGSRLMVARKPDAPVKG